MVVEELCGSSEVWLGCRCSGLEQGHSKSATGSETIGRSPKPSDDVRTGIAVVPSGEWLVCAAPPETTEEGLTLTPIIRLCREIWLFNDGGKEGGSR